MRRPLPLRRLVGLACAAAALLLLRALPAAAACDPDTCDAGSDCGFSACDGPACRTFFEDAGTPCRAAAGVCDLDDVCNGHSVECPDEKRDSSFVCRDAVDACDAAERCDGISNDCPADVGVEPSISRVTLLDREERPPLPNFNRQVYIELLGDDLCQATVDGPGFHVPNLIGNQQQRQIPVHYSAAGPSMNGTYTFAVNRGAASGTLELAASAPDGLVEILAPSSGATVGSQAVFSISNACSNCGALRAEIRPSFDFEVVSVTPANLLMPPLATPTELTLQIFTDPPQLALPDDSYQFTVEGIRGAVVADQAFAGDTSGVRFTYVSGASVWSHIPFDVPEAGEGASALAAASALAGYRVSRGWRVRRHAGLRLLATREVPTLVGA